MPTVLVIGDVMTDIVVRPAGPLAVGADTRADIRLLPGGSGANQACWLASEGMSVRFAARVGHDDLARQKLLFGSYGVDAPLAADASLPTGTLVTFVSPDGERSFLTDRAANLNLSRADLPDSLLDGVDLLHVSGYSFFAETPRDAVRALIDAALARKIPISVDPASYSFLRDAGVEKFLAWIRTAHIIFPNADEAEMLAGETDPAAQLDRLTQLFPVVAIKRGAEGAVAGDASGGRWSAPAPAATVLDTSGAGDAFLGGFLGAYLSGAGIEAALRRGVTLGSRAVEFLGGRPPLPD